MAGFLDKNTRIVDMVLTGRGRMLLSQGELNFTYWAAFDDEVDYNPFISTSGSMTVAQLSSTLDDQLNATLVHEAVSGYGIGNASGSDNTNVRRPIFTMAHGQANVPRMRQLGGPSASFSIGVKQQKIQDALIKKDAQGRVIERLGPYDRAVVRYDPSKVSFTYGYGTNDFPAEYQTEGFLIRVYTTGSGGMIEMKERRDLEDRISFNNDLILGNS